MKLTDDIIDDYLLGELDALQRQAFENELKSDDSVRARVDEAKLLRSMLASSAPDVPSKRLWEKIRAEISAAPAPAPAPGFWAQLLESLSRPRLRLGLGFAAAACLVVVGLQVARKPVPLPEAALAESRNEAAPAIAPAQVRAKRAVPAASTAGAAATAPAPAMAAARSEEPVAPSSPTKAAPREPTEVERALSDQDLDGVIGTLLRQRQAASLGSAPMARRGAAVRTVSYGGESGGALAPAAAPSSAAAQDGAYDSAALRALPSRIDANGFWNFRPAAMALNRRDWLSASKELAAAAQQAPEAAERAFARSTLQLLSQGGQPVVAQVGLADSAGLNVQSAERWQVFVDNHVARYSGGVVARMPGLRSEGDALVLDMAFDRASFSPGTRFTRLSGADSSKVTGAQGQALDDAEFRAPRGADYLLRANELRLK